MAQLDQQQVLEGHTDRVWNVAWSPTGKLAPATWHSQTRNIVNRRHIFFTGNSIASCSGDKTVRIWQQHGSSDTWVCAAILEETHHRSIRCSSWSPDGRYLATASFDATTAIWEVQVNIILSETSVTSYCMSHASLTNASKCIYCAIQTKLLSMIICYVH